jgi:hypothetical protein
MFFCQLIFCSRRGMSDWDWTRIVFDHVKIVVRAPGASIAFYKAVLEPLAIPPLWETKRGAQFANLVVWGDESPSGPCTSRSSPTRASRSTRSTARGSRPALRTTAHPACESSTAR